MTVLEFAEKIARMAHAGEFRRDGITPYIRHIEQVVENVVKRGGSDEEKAVAWLHDTAENCGRYYSIEAYKSCIGANGVTIEIVDAIDALTHRKGESYEDSIKRAKASPIARNVKIADNLANLSDNPTDKQIMKYAKSLQVLMS
jgi:(p)ppGpp synthase/HD superfamily hydrolase